MAHLEKVWGRVINPLWCLKAPSPATKKWIFEFCIKFGFRKHLQTFWPRRLVKSELSLGLMLIKPVLVMMMFCRAEKEGDWPLHLLALKLMIPYFFAAGHQNYARYALLYLRDAEALSPYILDRFLKGKHVTQHTAGIWNGMWTNMMIETTFMRYGKGPRGMIGITLKPESLKTWAFKPTHL